MTLFAVMVLLAVPSMDEPTAVVGHLPPEVREASGIVASRRHPGIFWVHNDSGNPPDLFAVRRDGSLVRKYRVGVPNIDWEDITTDDDGHLYIGDIGNNDNRLALRMIYRVDEPDPNAPDDGPLKVTRAWFYKFAGPKERFDTESLILLDDQIAVISKHRDGRTAELFTIPIEPASTIVKPAVPTRVAPLPNCNEAVTSASIDDQGKLLAVLTYKHVRIYRRNGRGEWVERAVVEHSLPDAEGITWDGRDLLIVAEDRRIGRVDHRAWTGKDPNR